MPDSNQTAARNAASVLISAAAFVVIVAGVRAAAPLLVPFILSIFIAVVAAPPVFWLERRGLPRALALLSVLAALAAVALGLNALVGASIGKFSRELPTYKERLVEETGGLVEWLRAHGIPVTGDEFSQYVDPGVAVQFVADLFNGFGGVLANALLIFLAVGFILFEAHSFPQKIRAVVKDADRSLARFDNFSANLMRYLAIKSVASLGTGALIAIWLAILGVDYPLLWGLFAFLLNYVPNIGSIIAAVPTVLFTFVQLGPASAAWVALAYAVVNVSVGSIIEPRFMGRGLGLSTLVVFASLVFWGWIFGPVGMFLSVPLTMTAKIALDSDDGTRWMAVLLGPEDALQTAPQETTLADADAEEHDGGAQELKQEEQG